MKEFYEKYYAYKQLAKDIERNTFQKIKSLFPKSNKKLRILDLGCGGGSLGELLKKDGHYIKGLDIMEQAVQIARQKGIDAEVYDLNNRLMLEDKNFDVVIASDIIEHLYQPLKIMSEIHRVLKDEGFAIIILPLHFDISSRLRILFGKGIVSYEHLTYDDNLKCWNYFHIRFFTLKEVFALIEESRFSIRRILYRPLMPSALGPFHFLWLSPGMNLLADCFPKLFASGLKVLLKKTDVITKD